MDNVNAAFNDYMNSFVNLSTKAKRAEIIKSINEISALMDLLASKEGNRLEFLKSREVLDINDGLEKEDDFLEAMFAYVENAKFLLGQYLDKKI